MMIYLDMDGVLANFNGAMIKYFGAPFDQLGNGDSIERWKLISNGLPNVYSVLDSLPDADLLVDGVLTISDEYGCGVGILTAIPKYGRLPNAEQHKREWLLQRWPSLLFNFKIGPYAVDKQKHARPGDILIDDSPLNIPQWNNVGGIGILHQNAVDSLHLLQNHMKRSLNEYLT